MENLPPHVIRLVYKEVSTLTSDPPEGIKVFPNEEDITDVQVTIEGPGEAPGGGAVYCLQVVGRGCLSSWLGIPSTYHREESGGTLPREEDATGSIQPWLVLGLTLCLT